MHRVLIPPGAASGDHITITGPETLHHLLHVLRVNVGDQLECFDGEGAVHAGPVMSCGAGQIVVRRECSTQESPPKVLVTLAQTLIKPERFEWALEKAAELGVARIIPMLTQRTTVRVAAREGRLARWQRIIESAATQCGRATIPLLDPPQTFEQVLKSLGSHLMVLPTRAEGGMSLAEHLKTLTHPRTSAQGTAGIRVAVLIGPEGDFTPEEVAQARKAGATAVSLGSLTLRSETAALAALAILQHELRR
ncbi:MAG: 16S rRNA (uracil(1498)-N(3))-methyltransferase [Candidatus Omnitrophica bacterium]|nr:16S rRNA (uracil(1498)-N(3))-methyltransferase [Candidatus Omnitrophota bacterium]